MTVIDHPTSQSPRYARRRQRFGNHVAAVIEDLQSRYVRKESSAIATMAQLRAAVTKQPGSSYAVLAVTYVPDDYMPQHLRDDGEGTDTEHAKHTALTLYALHQQSIYDQKMHRDGYGLGGAVSLLSRTSESPEAVRRRFAAIGTATSYEETIHHLRTLVRQLRDRKIGLDYGLLADDLVTLRRPGGHDKVRAWWGRDFYRTMPVEDRPAQSTPTTT